MLFTSLTYVLFFALFFGVYWTMAENRRVQNMLLLAGGYIFYGWWDWRFCSLMLFSSFWDFAAAQWIHRSPSRTSRRVLLVSSVGVNLCLLGYFKYANFFAENLHALAASVGWQLSPFTLQVILPVGISFYTFQSVSYVVDVYRRETPPCASALEYFTFVAFFPQLMAGPIERARHMLPQFSASRVFNSVRAVDGCRQILWGFFKKMVIADNLAPVVNHFYSAPSAASGGQLAVATVAFAFQIYCDFSAYSDIALGSARLLGFDLMRNFAYPYFSASPWEFWRRWHISLSTWFRDYLYIPLGGRNVSRSRRALNLMVTFLVSGLWHGASWNFVAWGALHGFATLPSIFRASKVPISDPTIRAPAFPLGRILGVLITFSIVCVGWVFFRAKNLPDALLILTRMFTHPLTGVRRALDPSPLGASAVLLVAGLLFVEWLQRDRPHPMEISGFPRLLRWSCYFVLGWMLFYWGARRSGHFIYFQF